MSPNEPTQGNLPGTPLDWLNQPPPPFKDEARAPAVDRELLWSLVRGELPEAEQRGAYRLIYSFRSWAEAHKEILVQHHRESQGGEQSSADGDHADPKMS